MAATCLAAASRASFRTVYSNYELVVVDNQSDDPETLEYLATLPGRVLRYPHEFNYPRQLNLAAASRGLRSPGLFEQRHRSATTDWLDRLIEQAMRPEVGAVGPRLLFPNGEGPARGHPDRGLARARQLDRVGQLVAYGRPAPGRVRGNRSVHGNPAGRLLARRRL
jgi:glycosyltransferase involved in cell wall biosynthesis